MHKQHSTLQERQSQNDFIKLPPNRERFSISSNKNVDEGKQKKNSINKNESR